MGRNCEEFYKKVHRFFIAKITINLAGFAHKSANILICFAIFRV